jgi:hypothetical protein
VHGRNVTNLRFVSVGFHHPATCDLTLLDAASSRKVRKPQVLQRIESAIQGHHDGALRMANRRWVAPQLTSLKRTAAIADTAAEATAPVMDFVIITTAGLPFPSPACGFFSTSLQILDNT